MRWIDFWIVPTHTRIPFRGLPMPIIPDACYKVVDNNFAQRGGMEAYLSASRRNYAVLPDTVLIEWHRKKAMATARHALQIACRYPEQIIVLRETSDQFDRPADCVSIVEAMIDKAQTRDFPAYCDTVINAPESEEMVECFAGHEAYAQAHIDNLVEEGLKVYRRFEKEDETLSAAEVTELKALAVVPTLMSPAIQKRTYEMAGSIAAGMIRGRTPDKSADPRDMAGFIDSLAFRYAAMMVGLWICRRGSPGAYPVNRRNVGADVMDIKIAAQASYFDGLLTHETRLERAFENAMSLIRALGGYRDSGRSGGDGVIGVLREAVPGSSI
ncbi:hypothetical protein FHT19_000945 [Novosphingobium sp. SG919]|nr:hypothetical protein [Novosphingobium sp. SG919]